MASAPCTLHNVLLLPYQDYNIISNTTTGRIVSVTVVVSRNAPSYHGVHVAPPAAPVGPISIGDLFIFFLPSL